MTELTATFQAKKSEIKDSIMHIYIYMNKKID